MRFFTTITAFLAAGFAVASPITSGQDVQVVEARAEDYSLSDINSQLKTIKGLIEKDFSGSDVPSSSELTDVTERLSRLIRGLVPLNLDLITGGDILDIVGILSNVGNIVGSLTSNLPLGLPLDTKEKRNLSYAPVAKEIYKLVTVLSKLVSQVLNTVYGAIGSQAAKEDPELQEKLLAGSSGLSSGIGRLFSLLGGLANLGDLIPDGN